MRALLSALPNELNATREVAAFWVNTYLAWVFRTEVARVRGQDSTAQLLTDATVILRRAAATARMGEHLRVWFEHFDSAVAKSKESDGIPPELFMSWMLMALTDGEPVLPTFGCRELQRCGLPTCRGADQGQTRQGSLHQDRRG